MIHGDSWWFMVVWKIIWNLFWGDSVPYDFNIKYLHLQWTCASAMAPSPSPWHRDGDAVSWAPCPSESRNCQAVLREGDRILPWLFPGSRLGSQKAPKRHQKGAPWLELTQPDPTQKNFLPPQTEQIPIWYDLIMCHGCQMMATDPNCKPTCFYLFNRKQKWYLNNSWQQAPQGLTTKMTTKQWHVQSFLYFFTEFCMAKRKLM